MCTDRSVIASVRLEWGDLTGHEKWRNSTSEVGCIHRAPVNMARSTSSTRTHPKVALYKLSSTLYSTWYRVHVYTTIQEKRHLSVQHNEGGVQNFYSSTIKFSSKDSFVDRFHILWASSTVCYLFTTGPLYSGVTLQMLRAVQAELALLRSESRDHHQDMKTKIDHLNDRLVEMERLINQHLIVMEKSIRQICH